MNKKQYIAPAMELAGLEAIEMMAASNEMRISDTITEDDAAMSNERRGGWGNLWE